MQEKVGKVATGGLFSHKIERKLVWYFNEVAGDMGLKSPFGTQLDMAREGLMGGAGGGGFYHMSGSSLDMTSRQYNAAHRARFIGKVMDKIGKTCESVLREYFTICPNSEPMDRVREYLNAAEEVRESLFPGRQDSEVVDAFRAKFMLISSAQLFEKEYLILGGEL